MERTKLVDLIIYGVIMLGAGYLAIDTLSMSKTHPLESVGPYTWPFILLVLLTGIAATLFLATVRDVRANTPKGQEQTSKGPTKTCWLLILLTLCYIYSLTWLGFPIATIIWFPMAVTFLGGINRKQLLLSAILTYAFIYLVFIVGLGLSLPRGVGIFGQFSRLLGF